MLDQPKEGSRLIYRHKLITRITHWIWAISFLFLLLSGLQIFNAHPTLYTGTQSGFAFDNAILSIGAVETDAGLTGRTKIGQFEFNTDSILGASIESGEKTERAFPSWATLPPSTDLATGRVIHFFFAWLLVSTLLIWLIASLLNRHLQTDIVPRPSDFANLPKDVVAHAKGQLDSGRRYNPLQRLSYAAVLLVLFPLMVATGLCMSPGMNAFAPWLLDVFGGRQNARTVHFFAMVSLVAFIVIHLLMVVLAGPINELRSIITGWYRTRHSADIEHER